MFGSLHYQLGCAATSFASPALLLLGDIQSQAYPPHDAQSLDGTTSLIKK
jgi:hypothetical protein